MLSIEINPFGRPKSPVWWIRGPSKTLIVNGRYLTKRLLRRFLGKLLQGVNNVRFKNSIHQKLLPNLT
jgi:hypothetical protein